MRNKEVSRNWGGAEDLSNVKPRKIKRMFSEELWARVSLRMKRNADKRERKFRKRRELRKYNT